MTWILGPSASWARYAFDLAVSRVLTVRERVQVPAVVDYLKAGHTLFVQLVEPGPPPDVTWVLGVGQICVVSELNG